jgi:hypothetical protein
MEIERNMRGEGEGSNFTIYVEWVIAVTETFTEGPWNAYDNIAKELGSMVIGPMTTEFGDGLKWDKKKGETLMRRLERVGTLNKKEVELEMDETIKMTAVGNPGDGIVLGEIRIRLDERWATEEELRVEQLRGCVRVKMKMYKIKGAPTTAKWENIDIDFDGDEGDIWTRSSRDRAGEEWIDIRSLEKLTKKLGIGAGSAGGDEVLLLVEPNLEVEAVAPLLLGLSPLSFCRIDTRYHVLDVARDAAPAWQKQGLAGSSIVSSAAAAARADGGAGFPVCEHVCIGCAVRRRRLAPALG